MVAGNRHSQRIIMKIDLYESTKKHLLPHCTLMGIGVDDFVNQLIKDSVVKKQLKILKGRGIQLFNFF